MINLFLKIPNSTSNLDIKLGNDINVGWNQKIVEL